MVCTLEEAWNEKEDLNLTPWKTQSGTGIEQTIYASDKNPASSAEINTTAQQTTSYNEDVRQTDMNNRNVEGGDSYQVPPRPLVANVSSQPSHANLSYEHEAILQLIPAMHKLLETTDALKSLTAKINAGVLVLLFFCIFFIWDFGFRFGQWYAHKSMIN